MAKQSPIAAQEDPNEALGRWLAQRQGAKGEYSKILNERENELLAANASVGPKSSKFQESVAELEEARLQRDEIYGVVRRPLNRHSFSWRYLALFVLILALLESSLNKFLFDVTLASYGFVSYATSFVVSFSMVVVAHFAGKCFRQIYSDYRSRIVWSYLAFALVITVVLAALIGILTVGRALTTANAGIASFDEMFSAVTTSVAQHGLWTTLVGAFSDLNGVILATVNIAGIFAAMILAVVMHDPDKDYDLAATRVERLRAILDRLDEAFTRAKKRVVGKYASHLSAASTRFKNANKQVMLLKHRLGLAPDDDDRFLIDEWDDLAETSGLTEAADAEPSKESTPAKVAHLKSVDTAPPEARRA